jgi:hypothetical protein
MGDPAEGRNSGGAASGDDAPLCYAKLGRDSGRGSGPLRPGRDRYSRVNECRHSFRKQRMRRHQFRPSDPETLVRQRLSGVLTNIHVGVELLSGSERQ